MSIHERLQNCLDNATWDELEKAMEWALYNYADSYTIESIICGIEIWLGLREEE